MSLNLDRLKGLTPPATSAPAIERPTTTSPQHTAPPPSLPEPQAEQEQEDDDPEATTSIDDDRGVTIRLEPVNKARLRTKIHTYAARAIDRYGETK